MSTQEYECPACGGVMEFDAPSQKLKCLYCDTQMAISDYKQMLAKKDAARVNAGGAAREESETENKAKLTDDQAANAGFGADKNVYICQSCGGEIIADKTQGATQCPFCGNNVTFKEVFNQGRRPDYVIPFKLTKQQAMEKYKSHIKGRRLLPKVFAAENHINEIKGVYIPYWLYDADVHASINCEATKVRTWSDSSYHYTETSYYEVFREGNVPFKLVPVDGSSKMPDDITESIEPFTADGMVPYDDAYLAGYVANQYDVDDKASYKRARERMDNSTIATLRNTVNGYSSVSVRNQSTDTSREKTSYALYPVWLLSTTWNGQNFLFAMNGQTGRFVGNLPVDKKAAAFYYTIGAVAFILLFMILEFFFKI